jgi:hypothetical protein
VYKKNDSQIIIIRIRIIVVGGRIIKLFLKKLGPIKIQAKKILFEKL